MSLFRFAVAATALTFVLLLVGGTVNPTGSSLACPDWPTCYGSFFPPMSGGVFYEHTHRLVAGLVGLMTLVLALWIGISRRADRGLRSLGLVALGLVVLQALLGGLTVLWRLPVSISMAHLALSMGFLVFLVYLCFRLWPGRPGSPASSGRDEPAKRVPRGLVLAATLAVFAQVLLGALVRHARGGRACEEDIVLCAGQLWPSFWPAQAHMIHRLAGLLVLALVLAVALVAARRAAAEGRRLAQGAALLSPVLTAAQVLVGVLLVRSGIGLAEAVAHTGLAALLLADLTVAYLALGPQVTRIAYRGADVRPLRSTLAVPAR